jgi:hypothetical protein
VFASVWADTQLVCPLNARKRGALFENEVALLMGSHSEFIKQIRSMSARLEVERLYLCNSNTGQALELLPLIQLGPPPKSKNACYFFNRLEQDGTGRFISYHFEDRSEVTSDQASETIRLLTMQ